MNKGVSIVFYIALYMSFLSTFVAGLIMPKEKNKDILKAVVLHEVVHIKIKDNLIKLVSIFIACEHWFNPLVCRSLVKFCLR